MKDYSTENIINIAITGHATTGKTILSEAMACNAGVIHKMGSIEEGTTLSDYRNYEIDNQHSISLTLLNLEWEDKKINILDAPGYLDFHGEVKSAVRVADLTGVVVSATDGIDIGTELSCEYADKDYHIPKFFIIKMVGKDQADFDSILSALKERYGRTVFPFTLPINQGVGFNKIADVLRKELFTFKTDNSGNFSSESPGDDWKQNLEDLHNRFRGY